MKRCQECGRIVWPWQQRVHVAESAMHFAMGLWHVGECAAKGAASWDGAARTVMRSFVDLAETER